MTACTEQRLARAHAIELEIVEAVRAARGWVDVAVLATGNPAVLKADCGDRRAYISVHDGDRVDVLPRTNASDLPMARWSRAWAAWLAGGPQP